MTVTDSPDPLGPHTVALSTGPTIPATVTPTTQAFGNVAQSATKTLSTLKVTNLSPFTLTVSQGITGTNAADFGVAAGGTCAGNTVCVIPVTFTPSAETAESATLTVSIDQDPTSPHTIALSGTGVTPVRLAPATTLAFGTVARPKSKALTITVTNLGTATLDAPDAGDQRRQRRRFLADDRRDHAMRSDAGRRRVMPRRCDLQTERASLRVGIGRDWRQSRRGQPAQCESDGRGPVIRDSPDDEPAGAKFDRSGGSVLS